MKLFIITACLLLAGASSASAETYNWTDESGVIHFTDSPEAIPTKFRSRTSVRDDITIRNPKVQEELKEQEQRAREDSAQQRNSSAPGIIPVQQPVPAQKPATQVSPPSVASDELAQPRTKSQRIQDNIKRREAEEAGKDSSGVK